MNSNMHMLHHISFSVSDIGISGKLYDSCLFPLGYRRVCSDDTFVGYGVNDGEDKFAISKITSNVNPPSPGFHLAFAAPDRKAVDLFYKAAIENGATDNGAPGLRPHYGEHYYAAFVIDRDGYHIEAVTKTPVVGN